MLRVQRLGCDQLLPSDTPRQVMLDCRGGMSKDLPLENVRQACGCRSSIGVIAMGENVNWQILLLGMVPPRPV